MKMKCLRCGQDFTLPDDKTDVCATCGDELRCEEDANIAQAEAEAQAEARAKWEAEEAEEAERLARDSY